MYMDRKGWNATRIRVRVNFSRDYETDISSPDSAPKRIDVFERLIYVEGDLDESQKERIIEIANKCPVHRTLEQQAKITTRLGKG